MNVGKQIEALNTKRKALVDSMTAITQAAEDESRTFNEQEQKDFDRCAAEVKGVDDQLARLETMRKLAPATAEPPAGDPNPAAPDRTFNPASIQMKARPKGQVFTRYVMALAASRGDIMLAHEISKRWKDSTPEVETILKTAVAAGTTSDADWATELQPYQVAVGEFIEMLRPETIMGRMTGFRRVPFNTRVQRQTGAATAGWVGEGKPKKVQELAFEAFNVPHSKIAVIVALSDELTRFSTPSAEATVQQELVLAVSQYLDEQFINPSVTASNGVRPASILNGAGNTATAGTSLDQVTEDLVTAMGALTTNNIPMRNRYWIMNPRTALYMMTLRNAVNGLFAFRDEMSAGRVLGIPFLTSNSVPIASSETILALVEASEILLADDGEATIDVSREASLQMDDAPSDGAQSLVSLWQNNLVGVRAERYVHYLRRRAAAAYYITGVTY